MNKEIYILGVGRNTIVTIDLAEKCGYKVAGLYHYQDGRKGDDYFGHKILGSNDELFSQDIMGMSFAISVGDNDIRSRLFYNIIERGGEIPTLIHPKAEVSKYAKIGKGCYIHAGSIVCASAEIGDDCVVSFNATVIHGAIMKNHSFIAGAGLLGANTIFEEYAFLGLNATTISNKVQRIAKYAVVGAGAVVTKPIDDSIVVAGNPAKVLDKARGNKQNTNNQVITGGGVKLCFLSLPVAA